MTALLTGSSLPLPWRRTWATSATTNKTRTSKTVLVTALWRGSLPPPDWGGCDHNYDYDHNHHNHHCNHNNNNNCHNHNRNHNHNQNYNHNHMTMTITATTTTTTTTTTWPWPQPQPNPQPRPRPQPRPQSQGTLIGFSVSLGSPVAEGGTSYPGWSSQPKKKECLLQSTHWSIHDSGYENGIGVHCFVHVSWMHMHKFIICTVFYIIQLLHIIQQVSIHSW